MSNSISLGSKEAKYSEPKCAVSTLNRYPHVWLGLILSDFLLMKKHVT